METLARNSLIAQQAKIVKIFLFGFLNRMSDDAPEPRPGWLKKLSTLLSDNDSAEDPYTAFLALLNEARFKKTLNEDTAAMMESLLDLHQTQVRDIMIPRGQITLIQENWSLDKMLGVIIDSGHSRYPVVDEDHEKILGILITKDLLPMLVSDDETTHFMNVLRKATMVPESKPLDAMLREFRTNRNHMAVVIDEYGNLSGLVTIEDVIEEIVGEIDDEHDEIPDAEVRALGDGSYQVKALMMIEHFNEQFDTTLSDEDADTIGGYVLQQFGRMPVTGEALDIEQWHLVIAKANQRRILSLKVSEREAEAED